MLVKKRVNFGAVYVLCFIVRGLPVRFELRRIARKRTFALHNAAVVSPGTEAGLFRQGGWGRWITRTVGDREELFKLTLRNGVTAIVRVKD